MWKVALLVAMAASNLVTSNVVPTNQLYPSVVRRRAHPLVVVGHAIRSEYLPLPPVPPETGDDKTRTITIRVRNPELVHFAVRDVLYGELSSNEVTFMYISHLGFTNHRDDFVLALQPVDGERWHWKLNQWDWDSGMRVFDTRDGDEAVPITDPSTLTRMPCAIRHIVRPLRFEQQGLPAKGILLEDLRELLAKLDPVEAEMGCENR